MKNFIGFIFALLIALVLSPIRSDAGPPTVDHNGQIVLQTHLQPVALADAITIEAAGHTVIQTYSPALATDYHEPFFETYTLVADKSTIRLYFSDSYFDERVHPPDMTPELIEEPTANQNLSTS